jgi:uncharacterized phage protein (TIGR02218 family)
MKVLPAGLQAHLDSGATTMCWCWRITRNDGAKLGFTDHDRDLVLDGTTFEAASGFTASEIEGAVGLKVDNLEVEGALRSETLNEADLAAGLYDNAVIEIFRVNWVEPEQRVLMRFGNLGEVTRGRVHFKCEVRGLAHVLQQPQGRIIQNICDADLGDVRCAIDLDQPTFKGIGAVTALDDQRSFTVSGLSGFASEWFSRGLLTWTSGANSGRKAEVKVHARVPNTGSGVVTLELWQSMAEVTEAGDGFSVTAGCNKTFRTCREKFDNKDNFRGFPHVPGNDFLLSYPKRGKGNDGRSMN